MGELVQKIKQRFCCHIDDPDNRNYYVPFTGYAFCCPKCKGYIAYFTNWNDSILVSEEKYNFFVVEGNKFRNKLSINQEKNK